MSTLALDFEPLGLVALDETELAGIDGGITPFVAGFLVGMAFGVGVVVGVAVIVGTVYVLKH